MLTGSGVNVRRDNRLVRGLDYYNDNCFEIHLGDSTDTLMAGGRYDDLAGLLAGDG
jgi:histidyl-tRNA synthetase